MEKNKFNIEVPNGFEIGQAFDGYHTLNELYDYRMIYNALAFNSIYKSKECLVVKSKKHSDGNECFGGGWFIVVAELSTGQVTNHYKMEYWDLFNVDEVEFAPQWDGHTPHEAFNRLHKYVSCK